MGSSAVSFRIPCGQCIGCRIRLVDEWTVRIMHESQMHDANAFLTLTYDDAHLPEDRSLKIEHVQSFLRRLRKAVGRVRFYQCGEYGPTTNRPHYHMCLFGYDFSSTRVPFRMVPYPLYNSSLLDELWGHGFTTIGNLTRESAQYVAGYTLKKMGGFPAEYKYVRTDGEKYWFVAKEKATMSLKPGIGAGWFEKFKSDVFPLDECVIDGKVHRVPRYYDSLIDEKELEKVKSRRIEKANQYKDNNTRDRLLVAEKVVEARTKLFSNRSIF